MSLIRFYDFSEFLKSSRDALASEAEVQIAYVNNKLIYPKRNNLDNYVIIPVSLGLVLVLVVFNCICQRRRLVTFYPLLKNNSFVYI